jgi:hypothetical protein
VRREALGGEVAGGVADHPLFVGVEAVHGSILLYASRRSDEALLRHLQRIAGNDRPRRGVSGVRRPAIG